MPHESSIEASWVPVPLAGNSSPVLVVRLGPEGQLRFAYDEAGELTEAWLGLERARGNLELLRLGGLRSVDVQAGEQGPLVRIVLQSGEAYKVWPSELAGLGDAPVQAALRILRSVARRPSDYGLSRAQLGRLGASPGEALLRQALPIGRRIGLSKRSLTEETREVAVGHLSWGLGKLLALACLADQSGARVFTVWLKDELRERLSRQARQHGVSPSAYAAMLLEQAVALAGMV